nr:immunoglobulin heavy chain junction region [Mus musculus]
CASDSYAMDYW